MVSRQPCGKTIDNSRYLQGPLVLGLPAVGPNVVVPHPAAACDKRHRGQGLSTLENSRSSAARSLSMDAARMPEELWC